MVKRIYIFGVLFLLTLIIVIGFIFIHHRSVTVSNPFQAIPSDASIVIQINDFHGLATSMYQKNKVFVSLNAIEPFQSLLADIKYLDSLALETADLAGILFKSKLYVSGHFIGGRKSDFLFILRHSRADNEKHVVDILSGITGKPIRRSERKYEGKPIFSFSIERGGVPVNYYLSVFEGNVLMSKSVILIENAIRQYSLPNSLLTNQQFAEIVSTAGKTKEANIFADLHTFPGMLTAIANDNFSRKLREYKNFGGWAELDVNTTEKQIILNGFISSGDKKQSFNSIFTENSPVTITADKILPASVSSFISVGAKDIHLLHTKFLRYLQEEGRFESRKSKLTDFAKKYKVQIEDVVLSLIDNEISVAFEGNREGSRTDQSVYVVIKCKSGVQTERKLKEVIGTIASKTGNTYTNYTSVHTIDSDTKFSIVEFPYENITGLLFGGLFSIHGKNYYTTLGNYLVFANSKQALGEFIYNNVLSKTLSTNETYKAFSSNLAQNSYLIFYTNLSRSSQVFANYLRTDFINTWESNFDVLQRIQPLGIQITRVSDMNYCNITVQYIDGIKGKPQTIWESLLDTSFVCKPYLVENHYSKQKEIFVQDLDNTIYLINKAGRILWKQKLQEPLNSKVFQIDYYKNGKLQLLFSTENYLHLIDRNGNYVERYPVRLREKATAGLALFDYENNMNYRIFIPCSDNKVYAYTKEGNIIGGWMFGGANYPVLHPLEHFRVEEKDFIVFGDKYTVYILDRRGNTRVTTDRMVAKSKHNTFYIDDRGTTDKSRIVTTDTAGNVVSIDFNGRITTTSLGKFTADHFFDFKDINANGNRDYIFVDRNILAVFKSDKSEIMNFSFPNHINLPPIYFHFSQSDRKTGIVDAADRKIYLINKDGSLYKGFPLEGSTPFSIGYLESQGGIFDLIVDRKNNFLYNYTVQ